MNKKIFIILIILIIFTTQGELYRVYVDQDYGFYKVSNLDNLTKSISYINKTLIIKSGDSVQWINYADPDEKLTILVYKIPSNLGKEFVTIHPIINGTLRWNYQIFTYKFNSVSKYDIIIDEYPNLYQRIVVENNEFVDDVVSDYPINIRGDGKIEEPIGVLNIAQVIYTNTPNINVTREGIENKPNYIILISGIIMLIVVIIIYHKTGR